MLPSLPKAANNPRAVVRKLVGKLSVDKQSNEFHEHVDTALRQQAANTTVASDMERAKQNPIADKQAAIREETRMPLRPTRSISSPERRLPGKFAAATKKLSCGVIKKIKRREGKGKKVKASFRINSWIMLRGGNMD